jgi:biotin carboxyl carrier protein
MVAAPVEAPGPGTVRRGAVDDFADVSGGDALLRIEALP